MPDSSLWFGLALISQITLVHISTTKPQLCLLVVLLAGGFSVATHQPYGCTRFKAETHKHSPSRAPSTIDIHKHPLYTKKSIIKK